MRKEQYEVMYTLEDKHFWYLAKREFIRKLVNKKPGSRMKILDLGCGTGGTSRFLEKWGSVDRVENSPHAFPLLQKRGLRFTLCNIGTYKYPPNYYDAVFLLDVLYHKNIKNVSRVLQHVHKTLKKGGLLVITDSAVPALYGRHDVVMMGRERFGLSVLSKAVTNAGFMVSKKSYVFFFLFPFFALQRLSDRLLPYRTMALPPHLINTLLIQVCRLEAMFLPHVSYPIGSSVIITATKL